MNRVAITIVLWNSAQDIERCIRSIIDQTYTDWELHLLDNDSSDDTRDRIAGFTDARIRPLVRQAENIGFAQAQNILLLSTSAPYALVLNPDTQLTPTFLEKLVDALDHKSVAGSASGLLVRADRGTDGIWDTTRVDSAGLWLHVTHRVTERFRERAADALSGPSLEFVFGGSGAATLYRRVALDATAIIRNGAKEFFDGSYGSYKEDVDLAYRLQLRGWSALCVGEARALHVRHLRGPRDVSAVGILHWLKGGSPAEHRLRLLSYRNHLSFLITTATYPSIGRFLATCLTETGKVIVLLLTNPSRLLGWVDLWKQRSWLREKRRQVRTEPFFPRAPWPPYH